MEKIFNEDSELLETVVHYLANSESENMYITDTIIGNGANINDINTIEAINALISRSYSVISKDGNTISFLRWSNLDSGRGIAYSINGSEPTLQFLTKLEALTESDWYYYEEDFNEWKRRNSDRD